MVHSKSCLLIDDDQDDQFVFTLAIKSFSNTIHCVTVNSGFAALKKLEQPPYLRPDFIFLDLNLPGINGFDCLIRIKENPELTHIPIVIYTTSSREQDIIKTKNLGAIAFITKPYHISELVMTLKKLFDANTEGLSKAFI